MKAAPETRSNSVSSRIPALTHDLPNAALLASGLSALADRIEGGAEPNPTALLGIRNTEFSQKMRLHYRAEWIRLFPDGPDA